MSEFQYVTIPQCATQMEGMAPRIKPQLVMTIPMPSVSGESSSSPTSTQPSSPTRQTYNISNLLLSSTLHLPNPPPTSPRDGPRLMSTREPLSLQATTVNFRRFVSKSGPMFWLQDRIEEVILWRKGAKVTLTWMAIYGFLCYFPRTFLLLPHLALIAILLATRGQSIQGDHAAPNLPKQAASAQQPKEGTVDWYANLQAIQNFMGAVSDLYDATLPFIPILTWHAPHTSHLLTVSCISLLLLAPIVILIPPRLALLMVGLVPFALTHPASLRILPTLLHPFTRALEARVYRLIDNDNLERRLWYSKKHSVELWENERWSLNGGWAKSNLNSGERKPWSTRLDSCCDVVLAEDGDVRSLTYRLSPDCRFIETEDWRLDREAEWAQSGADDYGWVFTDDAWQHPNPAPLEAWKAHGMTRRRRWVRRVYFTTDL